MTLTYYLLVALCLLRGPQRGRAETAGPRCSDRTKVYTEHGTSNEKYFYFDPRTYSLDTKDSSLVSNQDYRRLVSSAVNCTGLWCLGGEWKCVQGNSLDCYNVEHIIPKANKIEAISGCNVTIFGNLIMSYGKWNQQLLNGFYGEKIEIYGADIVASAYITVYRKCFGRIPSHFPVELCSLADVQAPANGLPNPLLWMSMIVVAGVSSVAIISIIMLSLKEYNRLSNGKQT
jgi:hypothetical protein